MTEKMLEEILQTEESETKVLEAVAQYRSEHYHKGEDKQLICDLLCAALRATRGQHDLEGIIYHHLDADHQMVTIAWSGCGKTVDVSCDSGIAMIRDILRALS
jgi:hypothetical protein